MLKKTIKYTDFNGNELTEDFYFHLSKAEIVKMEASENLRGGYSQVLKQIASSNDGRQIMEAHESIIFAAYGERTPDGKSFLKSPEISARFKGSPAYEELFMELVTDAEASAEFFRGIAPKDLDSVAQKINAVAQPQDFKPSAREQFAQSQVPTPTIVENEQPVETSRNVFENNEPEVQGSVASKIGDLTNDHDNGMSVYELAEKYDLKVSEVRSILGQ